MKFVQAFVSFIFFFFLDFIYGFSFFSFVFGYSIYRYAKPRFLLNKSCCLRLSLRSISKLFLLGISILPVCVCVCFCVRNFRHRSVLQRNNYALSWYVASSTDPIFLHTKLLNENLLKSARVMCVCVKQNIK